jgi:hypothetical protein
VSKLKQSDVLGNQQQGWKDTSSIHRDIDPPIVKSLVLLVKGDETISP